MTRKEAIELLEAFKRQTCNGAVAPIEPEALARKYLEVRDKSIADQD